MSLAKRIALFLLYVSLSGCATTSFNNDVTSISDQSITGCCSFYIIPSDESIDTASLAWRSFEKQLVRALELQGYSEAVNPDAADIAIVAAMGIGDPRTVNWSVPRWGQTGTKTTGSSTTGTMSVYGNTATTRSNTTYNTTPTYGFVGSTQGSSTVYDRWLELHAYSMSDKLPNGDFLEAWSTSVRSVGTTGDLSVVAPYMIAAGRPYFGKSLSRQARVVIREDSEQVNVLIE